MRDVDYNIDGVNGMSADAALDNLLAEHADIIRQLNDSDEYMPRVMEDAMTILINKGALSLTDFNEFARRKLEHRISLRERLAAINTDVEKLTQKGKGED